MPATYQPKGEFQMNTASAKLTRTKYGSTRLAVNTLVPNPFDSQPIEEAISTIGETRLAELRARAEDRNWSETRLEAEIRNLAEEVASHANDCEDD